MASPIDVTDSEDPRIAGFKNIRERDLVRGGSFVAEGTVVLRCLLRSPSYEAKQILILRNRLAGLDALLAEASPDIPILVAGRSVIDAVAGFAMHRGVLALGAPRVGPRPSPGERLDAIARRNGVVVVAIGIANHDNMGGIFRNAAAFAAGMVVLDATACDPLYRKAIRVSAGAVLDLPFERMAPRALIEALRERGFRLCALSPGGAVEVSALDGRRPVALFLGTEGEGLPAELMEAMETVRIDMAPGFDSLNVATSAAIALQRLYSARGDTSSGSADAAA